MSFRMLYHNILAVLRRTNLEQLKHKNDKLRMLSLKVFKKTSLVSSARY